MLGLPSATEISQALPKKAIFDKFDVKSAQKEHFDKDISRMIIVNAISPTTIPTLQRGNEVECIYLVEVMLKRQDYDPKNLLLLSKLIPQRIVFVLHYGELLQLAIYHTKLISSGWQNAQLVTLHLQGLDLDEVWENLVIHIGDIVVEDHHTLNEQIIIDDNRIKLLKEIELLEKKARNEKQPRKKLEMFEELKAMKRQLT